MLNELLRMERGASAAGLDIVPRYSDIKDVRKLPTLLVLLCEGGGVDKVRPVDESVALWSLRNGQQNSFPFVQPKQPLLRPLAPGNDVTIVRKKKDAERRLAFLRLANGAEPNVRPMENWLSRALLDKLMQRRSQLHALMDNDGRSLTATIDRFLDACDPDRGGDAAKLEREIVAALLRNLEQTSNEDWVNVGVALLLAGGGAFFFGAEVDGGLAITDATIQERISEAMRESKSASGERCGQCGLTGALVPLVSENFPQPNLPFLGQTFLFARNVAIKANDRYGRTAAESMPVGRGLAERLAATVVALTEKSRKGKTWRAIPGENPEESDLLIAYVDEVPAAEPVSVLSETEDDEEADEAREGEHAASIARYEKRVSRLVDSVKGKKGPDFRHTPVQLVVLRKVDPANRKIVSYGRAITAETLFTSANQWVAGARNLPLWMNIGVYDRTTKRIVRLKPPHVAPLALIRFSRKFFLSHGTRKHETRGLPVSEVLNLFFSSDLERPSHSRARSIAKILRFVLQRRTGLIVGVAHSIHRNDDSLFKYDRLEALRSMTIIGILLRKLQRNKDEYMENAAFKLGQLLAISDALHVGYCMDLRQGSIPPSLLGNQVLATAQSSPQKALSILLRRWKPYEAWAKRATYAPQRRARVNELKTDHQAEWNIRKALRQYRELPRLAAELNALLTNCHPDDAFRAELLLGYMAGLPAPERKLDATGVSDESHAMELES